MEISIYLAPHLRGQGVGMRLLRALLGALGEVPRGEPGAREWGVREVIAVVAVEGAGQVGAFYEGAGFVEVGVMKRVGWKMGRWVDVGYWQLSLGEREEVGMSRDEDDG